MKRKTVKALGIGAVALFTIFILITAISPNFLQKLFAAGTKIGADKPPIVLNEHIKALNDAYIAVSDAVLPTVVSISVTLEQKSAKNPFQDDFQEFFKFFGEPFQFETPDPRPSIGGGSGVIITTDGYIITNNHVVENAKEIEVTTYDKKKHKAKIIGTDPLTDLAVIKIEGDSYPVAHFANIEDVKIGELVIAVGNPLGLNSTITSGIISAIGRGQLSLYPNRGGYEVENFIQTDAPINPGNSGGGLFNLAGSLVGINTAIATRTGTYIGYGFAIPVDLVKAVAEDLIEDGVINRGYIGVRIQTLDEVYAKSVGLENVDGVIVQDVIKDSPAEKAGLESGDVILELDGKTVKTSNELQSQIVLRKAGDKVNLTIWRDGKKINKTVKLEPRKEDETALKSSEAKKDEIVDESKSLEFDKLGFTVEPLTDQLKEKFDVKEGVYISKVKNYSIAYNRGLTADGVIVKADRKPVSSISELNSIFKSKKSGEAVLLQVKYKDSFRIVAIEIP